MNIELKNAVISLSKVYKKAHNDACDNLNRETLAAEASAKKNLDDAVAKYNDDIRDVAYKAAAAAENPFLYAVTEKTFPNVCSYKPKAVKATKGEKSDKWDDVETDFNGVEYYSLKKLDDLNENGTFAHELSWSATLLSLRLPFAAARAQATALDLERFREAFGMAADAVSTCVDYLPETASNDAKAHNLCVKLAHIEDDETAISRNKCRELLQYAVNACMFKTGENGLNEYRVAKSDATWFIGAMANYRNHGTSFVKPDTMYSLMFDLLGHIVCGRCYNVAK